MKTQIKLIVVLLLLSIVGNRLSIAHAQGTAFTYQGRLNDGVANANGSYDFRFAVYDNGTTGTQQGPTLTNTATGVTNGLFIVTLDFGNQFPGAGRWLEIGVRTNGGGSFFTLSPRQALTPAPYAITAGSVVSGGLAAGTYGNAVTLNNAGNSFSGAFNGNGASVTNVNASKLGGLSVSSLWQTGGNTGTFPGVNILGSLDNQALELWVNGARALKIIPTTNTANLIGGSGANTFDPGVTGATIAGGGGLFLGQGSFNYVRGNFASIGGGAGNTASNLFSTVAGGYENTASGLGAFVGGGGYDGSIQGNIASGTAATVGGGFGNLSSGLYSTVAGGAQNASSNNFATVAGGFRNKAVGQFTSMTGGESNVASASFATVGGGNGNTASGIGSVVGGGGYDGLVYEGNLATNVGCIVGGGMDNVAAGQYATVGGGYENGAYGDFSTVAGGGYENFAFGIAATVGGGSANNASGICATVPGGDGCEANGDFSFAAGREAAAENAGVFIWADSQSGFFSSTGSNQFLIRAAGGVGIGTGAPETPLHIADYHGITLGTSATGGGYTALRIDLSANTGGYAELQAIGAAGSSFGNLILQANGGRVGIGRNNPATALDVNGAITCGSLNQTSDRTLKEHFAPVSAREVLEKVAAMPITRWNFKEDKSNEHLGPMAQDFHEAFGLGADDRHIATVDEGGVALAAIQGLNEKLEAELKAKDAKLAELQAALEELRRMVLADRAR